MILMAPACCPVVLIAALGTSADLVIDSEASEVTSDSSLAAEFPGSLIGNWDEETNPEGTQTRPGLFGGSGNMPVDMSVATIVDGSFSTDPNGGLTIDFDTEALTASIADLNVDLLGRAAPTIPLVLELSFGIFRTFMPDSLYFGATLPIPIGDATMTQLAMTQTGPSTGGVLVPNGDGTYLLTALVPIDVALSAIAFEQVIEPPAFPILLPVVGTLDSDGSVVSLTISFDQIIEDDTTVPPGTGFEDIPFDVPTILPPGATAHLLFSAALDSIQTVFQLTAELVASGEVGGSIPGDINGDGEIDFADLLLLLGDWGPCPGCPADIDGDGFADFGDLLILLGNWGE